MKYQSDISERRQAYPKDRSVTVIDPPSGCWDWRLIELWASRELIQVFVWRDFVATYKQTLLGPAWHIFQPMLTTVAFTVVFTMVAGLPTDDVPPLLFYLSGVIPWTYFSASLSRASTTFVSSAALITKIYFHRLTLPVAIVLSNLIALGAHLVLFLVVWLYYLHAGIHLRPTAWLLAMPLAVALLGGYALAGGVAVAALTTRFRDLGVLISFGVQILMFLTPVVYPASAVPAPLRWLVQVNPLVPPLEIFRLGFFGKGSLGLDQLALSMACVIPALVVALALFAHVDKTVVDTI